MKRSAYIIFCLEESPVSRRFLNQHPDACLVTGATGFGLWVSKQHHQQYPMIYHGAVRESKRLEEVDGLLKIGTGLTYEDALGAISAHSVDLGELIRQICSCQIRNTGTIGGNIANSSPIRDMPATLRVGRAPATT